MVLTKRKMIAVVLAGWLVVAGADLRAQPVPADQVDKLHKLIAPGPNDSQWMQVPWMPSTNIYAARKKAAQEGKPLLLWHMAGEPLGPCGGQGYDHGRVAVNAVAHLIKEHCVAIGINGHMGWLRKTDGADGAFFKANTHPSGGTCFVLTTPSGKKLAGGNGPSGAREALTAGLKKWQELTEEERKELPPGKEVKSPEAERCTPPPGGLILRSFVRNLKKNDCGELVAIAKEDLKDRALYPGWSPVYTEPAHFNLWLTAAEWQSLVPPAPKKGDSFPVPDAIQKRIFRYHLVNGTFGLPGRWALEQIRKGVLTLTVEEVSPVLRMRLQGSAFLATDADPAKAQRGFDARLAGVLTYDPNKRAFTRFDVIALGDYWGGDYEGGRFKRPGRTPLGISFELVRGDTAIDRIPPLVHMDREQEYRAYFTAQKQR